MRCVSVLVEQHPELMIKYQVCTCMLRTTDRDLRYGVCGAGFIAVVCVGEKMSRWSG